MCNWSNTEGTNTGWVNNNFIQKLEQETPTDSKLDPAFYEYLKLGEIKKCLELLPKSDPKALLIRAEFPFSNAHRIWGSLATRSIKPTGLQLPPRY